jgi:hypothetical protein
MTQDKRRFADWRKRGRASRRTWNFETSSDKYDIKSTNTNKQPHHPHTTATMVKLEEVEDEHFNTQQTGEDAWISDSDSGEQQPAAISCAASHITLSHG